MFALRNNYVSVNIKHSFKHSFIIQKIIVK